MAVINLRNVPEELARAVKATAASEGITLRDFILGILERDIRRGGWTAAGGVINDEKGISARNKEGGARWVESGNTGGDKTGAGVAGGSRHSFSDSAAVPESRIMQADKTTVAKSERASKDGAALGKRGKAQGVEVPIASQPRLVAALGGCPQCGALGGVHQKGCAKG